jgi:hypothetical protein
MTPLFRIIFRVNMLFLALSGVGHMPIFKRYYIADIPGFGWLAEFHITLTIHYLTAALFLSMVAWIATTRLLSKPVASLTPSARMKIGLYMAIIASGGLLLVKNLKGIYLPATTITATDLIHLIGAVTLGVTALTARMKGLGWLENRNKELPPAARG